MNSLNNIERTQIPYDIITNYIKLYKSIGNNHYNHKTLESDNAVMVRQTIGKDVQFFAMIFNVNISEGRIKSLIHKGVLPKNKEERFIINLFNAFEKIHNETSTFELLPTEIFDMLHFLFNDVISEKRLQFNKVQKTTKKVTLLSSNYSSKRDTLEELIKRFNEIKKENKFELSFLVVSFYVDFLKSDIFTERNREIALVLLYILLLTHDFEVFEYISFFEAIYINVEEFDKVLLSSMYNWEEGFNNVIPLHRFILKISLVAYDHINSFIRDYEFDRNLNKSDNIENTINKLDDIFSKDEIRLVHPYISDSTINRTLKRLRDEDKIRPLGKGRSAKWIKLYTTPTKKISYEQLDLKI